MRNLSEAASYLHTQHFFPFWRQAEGRKSGELILQSFYERVAGLYRGWHIMEGSGRSIIDFDLTPNPQPIFEMSQRLIASPPTQKDRRRLLSVIGTLTQEEKKIQPPLKERDNYAFLQAKLGASLAFAKRLAGETTDPFVYIRETMGVEPKEIPEEILAAQKQKVEDLFRNLGGGNFTEEFLRAFYEDEERRISPEEMVKQINHHGQVALSAVERFINRRIGVDYRTEVVDKDAYWFNWADGTTENFRLQVNTHERHRRKLTVGKAQAMAHHEIAAHFGMMQQRAEFIKRGMLHEVFGLTTVHDPEQVILEGLAQTLNYFIPELDESLGPEGRFEIELYGLRQMAWNNAYLRVISPEFTGSPEQLEGIIQYIQGYYPLEGRENILKEVFERRKDPKLQAYRYSYGIGFLRHRDMAQGLSPNGKREFLRQLWGWPFTPEQEENLYTTLRNNPRYRSS